MQSHQRYFPLEDGLGGLHPGFLAVSNGDPAHAITIVRGNEGVLDARLQDAAFSYDRDREAGLEALGTRLEHIVFRARLGTMADKRARLEEIAPEIAAATGDQAAAEDARRAARLAKADQGAVLVAEFSDLEGYVAGEYARAEGVDEDVCVAVAEHYLPEGPRSPLPSSAVGAAVAVADKLDGVVGAFLVGEEPTGSRDPYAVRRAASGIVRIALERGWDVDLGALAERLGERMISQGASPERRPDEAATLVRAFLEDRLAHQLREEGSGPEAIAAAIGATRGGLAATAGWARQIDAGRDGEAFARVATAATRASRLGEPEPGGALAPAEPAELALARATADAAPGIARARAEGDLAAAVAAGVPLAEAIDRFLTDVLVNAEDPEVRRRRLGLVRDAATTLARIADFSKLTDGGR